METIKSFSSGFVKIFRFILSDFKHFLILVGLLSAIALVMVSPFVWDTVTWKKFPDWLGSPEPEPIPLAGEQPKVTVYMPTKLTPSKDGYEFYLEIENHEPKEIIATIEINEQQTYIHFTDQTALPIRHELLIPAESSQETPHHNFAVVGKNRFYDPAIIEIQVAINGKLDRVSIIETPIDLITIPLILIVVLLMATIGPSLWYIWNRIRQ